MRTSDEIMEMDGNHTEEWKAELERTLGMCLGVPNWPKKVLDKLRGMNTELSYLYAFQRTTKQAFSELNDKQGMLRTQRRRPDHE